MSGKEDYLEVDDPINGQSYVCLSFVSPENMIQNKEAFKTAKFLQSIAKEKEKDFKYFYNQYNDFMYKHHDSIQRDFDKDNKMKTNIRGVKVRGVFQTEEEARRKAKSLQSKDTSFNVFIGPVGYWLPWDPCADNVAEEEFMNDQLNEMIKKYKENEINKDKLYEEDKRDKIKRAEEDNEAKDKERELESEKEKELEAEKELENANNNEEVGNIGSALEDEDPWMKNKLSKDLEPEPEHDADPVPEEPDKVEEVSPEPEPEHNSELHPVLEDPVVEEVSPEPEPEELVKVVEEVSPEPESDC